jgi:lipoate-protein ligase B
VQLRYLGLLNFKDALAEQERAVAEVQASGQDIILGFETKPTVTLGARGSRDDLLVGEDIWAQMGYEVVQVDRGGQATIHNPGQLLIFPIVKVDSVRDFTCRLIKVTRSFLEAQGLQTKWNEQAPGLYSEIGKVVSMGLRIRQKISTHGLAINVHNDLSAFSGIRVCGAEGAHMDNLDTTLGLEQLFLSWGVFYGSVESFSEQVDKVAKVDQFTEVP